ncbi:MULTISPECIES: ATP-binding protein [unclassified Streptomyces]|uniref:ATP-binding protein n=1 Tax=unclassified Streptomyces TaxID=2593676 RepID=UPI002DD87BBA|nr:MULTISPECIES: ATP-binding protein [unclassified Streptomyces]WSA91656.1 ATP-binding protein [Streptomyces sp. NBC_01795]WSB76028.1 ATP-binding protein [Streptomyces sp. NBC_01775]WSS15698.1 ATP-binding protein [Streptomyces sp. NBC_01186]WSS44538.1 ATP-binding protein [Streptomyces sp. NBC_01187]
MTRTTAGTTVASAAGEATPLGFETGFLPAESRVAEMRRITADHLRCWGLAECVDSAILAVSELVTNAVQYGYGQRIGLRVTRSALELRIEVSDDNPAPAQLCSTTETDENGRGLFLVAVLAHDWGVSVDGKTTWCTFRLPTGRP